MVWIRVLPVPAVAVIRVVFHAEAVQDQPDVVFPIAPQQPETAADLRLFDHADPREKQDDVRHGVQGYGIRDRQNGSTVQNNEVVFLSPAIQPCPRIASELSSSDGFGEEVPAAYTSSLGMPGTGRKTLIVDTDLRRGTLRNNLRLQPGRGLSDLLM